MPSASQSRSDVAVERSAPFSGAGGRLVAADGRTLPLRGVGIRADAAGGLARVVIEQRFANPYPEPLRVTYQVPLPPEGALAGYVIQVGERRIVGEVDRLEAARERFEEALLEGRTAGLVDQDRSNLFTQEIGNIPPGTEVVASLTIDQRLRWLEEGTWEWRVPTTVAPRYLGREGRVPDAGRVSVDVAEGGLPARLAFALTVRDALAGGSQPTSPSHAIGVTAGAGGLQVALADPAGAPLDRDLVVRWPVARAELGLSLDTGRPRALHVRAGSAYGLLTVVPPAPDVRPVSVPRDLIVLLDTSGSMSGEPLDQARAVVRALVDGLDGADRLELIAFSDQPRRWRRRPVAATPEARAEALRWLDALGAGGGTEMGHAVEEALRPLRQGAQRQVVFVTDGLVGFEREIVSAILQGLPATSRLHAVAVGSSVNRGLTAPAARAGRGAEIVIGPGEDPRAAATRLVERMRAPILTEVELSGSGLLGHAPERLPDAFAAAPLRVAVALRPEGGELTVRGKTAEGAWEARLDVPAVEAGSGNGAVVTLFAREAVEDLEMRAAGGERSADAGIERLGLDFQIATRLTSWVAVSEEPTVDPTQPTRRERLPHALPHGLSAEGLGLRGVMLAGGPFDSSMRYSVRMAVAAPSMIGVDVEYAASFEDAASEVGPLAAITARVTLRKGRELALEIRGDGPIDWAPTGVTVVWADGKQQAARVDGRRSTRPGLVAAGRLIRLVLLLDEDAPAVGPARVEVQSDVHPLVIDVVP